MKDEEMFNEWKSEQYKDQSTEEKMEFVEHLHTFPRYFKKAFLAGLKAGRKAEREYAKNNIFTTMKEQGFFPVGKWHKIFEGKPYYNEYWDLPQDRLPEIMNFYFVKLKNGFIKICKLEYDHWSKKKCFYDLHGGKQSNVAEWLDYPEQCRL